MMIGDWAKRAHRGRTRRARQPAGVVCAPVYTAAGHPRRSCRGAGLVVEWEDDVHGTIAGNGVGPS